MSGLQNGWGCSAPHCFAQMKLFKSRLCFSTGASAKRLRPHSQGRTPISPGWQQPGLSGDMGSVPSIPRTLRNFEGNHCYTAPCAGTAGRAPTASSRYLSRGWLQELLSPTCCSTPPLTPLLVQRGSSIYPSPELHNQRCHLTLSCMVNCFFSP